MTATPTTLQDPHGRPQPTPPNRRARAVMPLAMALPVAAAAAVLMDLAYPEVGFWPAAFAATGLLLLALIGRSVWGAVAVGAVFGLLFFGLLVSWTTRYLGPVPWAALTVVEGTLTAVGIIPLALAYRWVPRAAPGPVGRLLLLPGLVAALWTGREVLLGAWPYGGLPWARLGITQADSPLVQTVSWVGVSGLTFLMVFTVAAAIETIRTGRWRRPFPAAVPAVTTLMLVLVPAFPTTPAGTMRVGAVQGNGPSGYFDQRTVGAIARAQGDATGPVLDADVDLVVWPEGLDADPFQTPWLAEYLTGISTRAGAPLLANAATTAGGNIYNTSFLWDPATTGATPQREQVQTHAKRHPVPFGEYVPDRAFYTLLAPDLVGLLQRDYTHGTDVPLVTVGGVPVGLAICFDVIYDEVIAESITAGAELLVFQTNNADFRGTDENLQQLAVARIRAVETGRTVVNVSTVGTSQIIRPDGSTLTGLPAGQAGAMIADTDLRAGLTPAVLIGQGVSTVTLWGGLGGLALTGAIARRRRPPAVA